MLLLPLSNALTCMSPSSEDSDDRCPPPTPPPRRFLRGSSFRLPCLTKGAAPVVAAPAAASSSVEEASPDRNLMTRLAASLRFSPLPVLAVAGLAPPPDAAEMTPQPTLDRTPHNHMPLHRASYHGPGKYVPEMNGVEVANHMQKYNPNEKVIGSAENLVGRVLQEQGLGRYCDPEFVKATQRELAEAINLSPEELDRAAHRLMLQQRPRGSNPYLYQPDPQATSLHHLSSLQPDEMSRPRSQQNYHQPQQQQQYPPHPSAGAAWDSGQFGDTRL